MKTTLLAAVLVLSSLTTVGAFAQAGDANSTPQAMHAHHTHDPHRQAMHLSKKLGLSADQTAKLEPILAQHRDQAMAIRQNTSLSPDQKHQQMHDLKRNTHQQLSSVLTPEQMQQWKSMRRAHKQAQQTAPTGA